MRTNIILQLAYDIARQGAGLSQRIIHGISMNWRGHPLLEVRLKEAIDIDTLPKSFDIKVKRGADAPTATYYCEISGVRSKEEMERIAEPRTEDPNAPWIRWVTIEGSGYIQTDKIIKDWLHKFGEFLTEYEEEPQSVIDADPEDGEEGEKTLGTSRFKVKMRIVEHIPQYLPMNGRKVKIYYKGIEKLCLNCYEPGHLKAECENERKSWLEYTARYIKENKDFEPELFGRWIHVVRKWENDLSSMTTSTVVHSETTRATTSATATSTDYETEQTDRVSDRIRSKQRK
jgi:hypothetical protein